MENMIVAVTAGGGIDNLVNYLNHHGLAKYVLNAYSTNTSSKAILRMSRSEYDHYKSKGIL